MQPKMNVSEMNEFLTSAFPQINGRFEILEIESLRARVRLLTAESDLRPGGTVSGPSMFGLADVAFYIATLAMIGPKALTVTTNVSIDFMRKPEPTSMLAEARILKLGRTLSVGDVTLYSEGKIEPVAHANVTYSIPPK